MEWTDWLLHGGRYLIAAFTLLAALLASGHAIVRKRDSRAAVSWIVVIWLMPLAGPLLYFVFGINRLKRRAILLRGGLAHCSTPPAAEACSGEKLAAMLRAEERHLIAVAQAISGVIDRRLLPGNRITPLLNGDAAYPAMLDAIAGARHSVTLSIYIFDHDEAGLAFAKALGDAARRGVEVRVLVDATGTRYSWPAIPRALRREGVRHALFLPTFPLWQVLSMNLRNHRKIMVADGRVGFTGGLNIRDDHWLERQPSHPVRDLHFRIEGPVVAHLQEVFADDWFFTTREALRGERWFPRLEGCGPVIARGIADGPDEDFENLRWAILAALSAAQKSVRIATPYFLPDPTIIAALNLAALRGVTVDILLPGRGNLPFVQWAATAQFWQVIERGCRLWQSPPPFDHSKLFIVDDCWALIGSTNWDPRSLRLNFEFNVECYDPGLACTLGGIFDAIREQSHRVTLAEVDARPLPVKLRDGIARLFAPYL
jgi:cardiolipin synthase